MEGQGRPVQDVPVVPAQEGVASGGHLLLTLGEELQELRSVRDVLRLLRHPVHPQGRKRHVIIDALAFVKQIVDPPGVQVVGINPEDVALGIVPAATAPRGVLLHSATDPVVQLYGSILELGGFGGVGGGAQGHPGGS